VFLLVKVFEATPILTISKLTGNYKKKDFTRKNNLTFLPQTDIMRHYNLLKPAD
jgi:propanediol dehydratase small subunit